MNALVKIGDITTVQEKDTRLVFIAHCCNDENRMGSGVAAALANKWPNIKGAYHAWFDENTDGYKSYESADTPRLGEIQIVSLNHSSNFGVNIIGQKSTGIKDFAGKGLAPVRYLALTEGFLNLRKIIKKRIDCGINSELHIPLLGCDLAGGEWQYVEQGIVYAFDDIDIDITLWVLDESKIPSSLSFNKTKVKN